MLVKSGNKKKITHQKCQKVISGLNRGVVSRVFSYWPSLWWYSWSNFFLVHWHHTPHNNAIIDFPFFGAQVHILKTNIEYLLCPWLPCFWKTIQPLKIISILKSSETCIQAPLSFYPTKYLSQRNEYKRIWMAACSTRCNKNGQGYQDYTKTIPFSFWCLIFR